MRFGAVESWYGGADPVEKTIAVAKQRIVDLDGYLRTGEPKHDIGLIKAVAIGPPPYGAEPVDPTRFEGAREKPRRKRPTASPKA